MHWLIWTGVAIAVEGLALGMAVHSVMRGRTAQGTVAWTMSLIFLPWLALPLYLVLGDRKFSGYVRAKTKGAEELDKIAKVLKQALLPFAPHETKIASSTLALEKLAHLPFTRGNQVDLLINGKATFDALIQAIDEATSYVIVEFYIFRDDGVGRRLHASLLNARKRDVRVYLLYDEFGSYSLPSSYLKALTDAGCECSGFRTTPRKRRPFRINFRNHRKIVVVDGSVALVGGHNVGDEYLSLHKKLTPWRDTHVAIRGPAVQCVQMAFLEDWFWATRKVPELDWQPQAAKNGDTIVLIAPSSPADEIDTCSLLFTQIATSAKKRLWFASPYFVPDESLTSALQLAGLRGADTKVIIPDLADRLGPKLSSFTFYDELFPAGVKLYRYQHGFTHQKVAVADDVTCVGTANLDNRSFRINFEITAVVADAEFAAQAAEMLANDLQQSRAVERTEFRDKPFWFRFACRLSRLMSPLQ